MSDAPINPRLTDFVCHVAPGVDVRLEDIPGEDLIEVEKTTGVQWFNLVGAPLGDATRGLAMYRLCCTRAGVEPRRLSARELWNVFELVEDDRPTLYDGGLPDPKADDQRTESSSSS